MDYDANIAKSYLESCSRQREEQISKIKDEIRKMDRNQPAAYSVKSLDKPKKNQVKKKKCGYDYRELSGKILRASTPYSAAQAAASASVKVGTLKKMLGTGAYDDNDVKKAIQHAQRMERAAKKRMRNLETEEQKKRTKDRAQNEEKLKEKAAKKPKKKTYKKVNKETEEVKIEARLSQIKKNLKAIEADQRRFNRRRKNKRLEEMHDVFKANMDYLYSRLEQMEREQAEADFSCEGFNTDFNTDFGGGISSDGVSLELGGAEIDVPSMDVPVSAEGGAVDITV